MGERGILKLMKKTLVLFGLILLGAGLLWLGRGEKEEVQRAEEIQTPTLTMVQEGEGGEEKMRVLMVVAPENFRDEELFDTQKVLEEKGIEVEIASKGVTEAQGMLEGKASVDKDLTGVKAEDYDGIVFVGGSGASVYFNDPKVQSLAKEAYEKGKVVAAICIAPSILANAGLLEGKKATSFPSEAENLKSKGVNYTGEEVTVEGRIVTAKGPDNAIQFGEKIAEVLGEH